MLGWMSAEFLGFVDRRMTKSTWRHVCLKANLGVEFKAARGRLLEPVIASGSACHCRWRPGSWLLVVEDHKAHFCGWFH